MNTLLFMPFSGVSLFHSQSAFSSWEIEITLQKTPIVTGWVIYIPNSILSCENANPRHVEDRKFTTAQVAPPRTGGRRNLAAFCVPGAGVGRRTAPDIPQKWKCFHFSGIPFGFLLDICNRTCYIKFEKKHRRCKNGRSDFQRPHGRESEKRT